MAEEGMERDERAGQILTKVLEQRKVMPSADEEENKLDGTNILLNKSILSLFKRKKRETQKQFFVERKARQYKARKAPTSQTKQQQQRTNQESESFHTDRPVPPLLLSSIHNNTNRYHASPTRNRCYKGR